MLQVYLINYYCFSSYAGLPHLIIVLLNLVGHPFYLPVSFDQKVDILHAVFLFSFFVIFCNIFNHYVHYFRLLYMYLCVPVVAEKNVRIVDLYITATSFNARFQLNNILEIMADCGVIKTTTLHRSC